MLFFPIAEHVIRAAGFRRAEKLEGSTNRCSLHCRLAKFCGLMINAEYGAVIGRETRLFV
jgi:hypothetical protein